MMGTPEATLFALLLLAHVLADFVLQPDWMVRRKREPRVLVGHTGIVLVLSLAAIAPYATTRALVVSVGLALAHAGIDALKLRWEKDRPQLGAFLLDQALHVGTLGLAVLLIAPGAPLVGQPAGEALVARAAAVAAGYLFLARGGAAIVRLTLHRFKQLREEMEASQGEPRYSVGAVVGMVERALIATFVIVGVWEGVAGVIAAKSIARYPEFKRGHFADYFLLGSLVSATIAIAVGLCLRWVIGL